MLYNTKLQKQGKEVLIQSDGKTTITYFEEKIKEYQTELAQLEEKVKKKRNELENINQITKEEANREKRIIIEAARKEAEVIRAKSKEEVERGYKEGFNAGFKEGEEKGLKSGEVKLRNLWEEGLKFVSLARTLHDNSIKEAYNDVVNLAFVIAEKILRKTAEVDKELVKRIVLAATELLFEVEEMRILVNPKDKANLEEIIPDILAKINNIKGVRLQEDKGIGEGECKIETNYGTIDATFISQLIQLASRL